MAVVILYSSDAVPRHFQAPLPPATYWFWFFVALLALSQIYDLVRVLYVEREFKAARYQSALEILGGPHRWPNSCRWQLLHAKVLFYWDRASEAEPILRNVIDSARGDSQQSLGYENLGGVLMAQGRYDEAREAFEAAAQRTPARPSAPNGFAELLLRQGIEPKQALLYAEQALGLYNSSRFKGRGGKERLAPIRGNYAWALGSVGRSAETQRAIRTARSELDERNIPETAAFHWRAGMAMLALGETSAAENHFRRSSHLDPRGYYGKLAAHQLTRDHAAAPGA